jgi:aryl-alcohol dehydrogenase-like predicted oxidoreductase
MRVLGALDEIAEERHTSQASVALAWLLSQPNVVAPVVSASRPEQVGELTSAVGILLTRHELTELDRASAWKSS